MTKSEGRGLILVSPRTRGQRAWTGIVSGGRFSASTAMLTQSTMKYDEVKNRIPIVYVSHALHAHRCRRCRERDHSDLASIPHSRCCPREAPVPAAGTLQPRLQRQRSLFPLHDHLGNQGKPNRHLL